MNGKSGQEILIRVPVGTVVKKLPLDKGSEEEVRR